MALNGLLCADVPLRTYTLSHSPLSFGGRLWLYDYKSYTKNTVGSALSRWRSIAARKFAKHRPSKFYGSFSGGSPQWPLSAYGPDTNVYVRYLCMSLVHQECTEAEMYPSNCFETSYIRRQLCIALLQSVSSFALSCQTDRLPLLSSVGKSINEPPLGIETLYQS